MFPNQVQRRRPALSCRADSRVACETQGDMGKGVSGGATRKPRDESGQARAAPPPPVGGGVEIAPSFPSSPRPWHPGFQFCSLESCPCFQGFCVSEGRTRRWGRQQAGELPPFREGSRAGISTPGKHQQRLSPPTVGLELGSRGGGPGHPLQTRTDVPPHRAQAQAALGTWRVLVAWPSSESMRHWAGEGRPGRP